ncbi:hypothetical protein RHO14_07740 [Orbus wheelerorum]|uniref:hypothetical protein n=1 Tax=Orbus wheelerorum TaxID=3074111 RepID=UPI00370D3A96
MNREEVIEAFGELIKGKGMSTGSTEIVYIYSAPGVIVGAAAVAIEAGVPVAIVQSSVISAGSNGVYQLINKPLDQFNLTDFSLSAITGAAGSKFGVVGNSILGGSSGFVSSLINGKDPVSSTIGGVIGGGSGSVVDKVAGPIVGSIISEAVSDNATDYISDDMKQTNK